MINAAYIVDGRRTPFCRIGTEYRDMSPAYLASEVVKHLTIDIDTNIIDEVVFGCVSQPADSMNIARYISMHGGIPKEVPAVSVHRNCASGLEAITHCCDKIAAGNGDIFIAGGTESMTKMPLLYNKTAVKKFAHMFKQKTLSKRISGLLKFRPSDFIPDIGLKLGLSDTLCDMNMGETAELLARKYSITREEQDKFAHLSHHKAIKNRHLLAEEIVPVYLRNDDCIKSFNGKVVTDDNGPREDTTVTKLNSLRPVFEKGGTVTPGNASQLTDGAGAVLLMSEKGLKQTGCEPIGKIVKYAYAGCEPSHMGIGPVAAIEKLKGDPTSVGHKGKRFDIHNMNLIEINEAFAAQTLAVINELGLENSMDIINVNGGSISLGHPVGASGARIVITLLKELRRRKLQTGLATLCVGGGQGGALWIETC